MKVELHVFYGLCEVVRDFSCCTGAYFACMIDKKVAYFGSEYFYLWRASNLT